jgi:hypothetical protein
MTLRIMAHTFTMLYSESVEIFGTMALAIMTPRIMTLAIMTLFVKV